MPIETKTLYGIIAFLIAIVIIVSGIAALYYYNYDQAELANQSYVAQLKQLDVKYISDIAIDYGNGSKSWYNNTRIEPGLNLYTLTLLVTNGNVNSTCCEFGSHFVEGIGGVQNNAKTNHYWFVWTFNGTTSSWQTAQAGVDQIKVTNGSVFAWTYCTANVQFNPTCTPP
jgi:hypothetical protein